MRWQDLWADVFDEPPADATSREVSVQEVLAGLITQRRCAWFESYEPTDAGRTFLEAIWAGAFGDHGDAAWFVSEFHLPVPEAWRTEIPYRYRCPDFACGAADRVLIVELKTERGSYSARQMVDYLRLVRHKLPDCATDVALLAPHRPGAEPPRDSRQRYGELTWADLIPMIVDVFGADSTARRLSTFLEADLATTPTGTPRGVVVPDVESSQGRPDRAERVSAAVAHAVRIAPSVATSRTGDATERGIDVSFDSVAEARSAKLTILEALTAVGYADTVTVWLWQPSSTGYPTTPAGHATGRELRLAPKRRCHP